MKDPEKQLVRETCLVLHLVENLTIVLATLDVNSFVLLAALNDFLCA